MQLSDEQINKFQKLWKKHFGEKISRELALELGINLVRLMQLTYKPVRKSDFEKIQARDAENN